MSGRKTLKDASLRVTLGAVVRSRAGKTPARGDARYWGGEVPWLTAKDLKRHRLESSIERITTAAVEAGAPLAAPNDVLILVRGMTLLKDVPVGLATRPVSYNQDVRCLHPTRRLDGSYLAYVLAAGREQLKALVTQAGHGTGRLDSDALMAWVFHLPPRGVQRWIARCLEQADEALDRTQALITAKRAFKRAMMNDLLTGRRRFPELGPSGDGASPPHGWVEHALRDVCDVRVSTVDKHSRDHHSPVRLCNYMDVWSRELITDNYAYMKSTASPDEIARFGLAAGDVLLTKDSETREDIAEPAFVVDAGPDLVLGYHCALLRPNPDLVDGHFLATQLRHPRFRKHFVRAAQGASRYGLTIDALNSATVWLPSLEEQRRISTAERLASEELDLLEAQVERLNTLKRGMMQRLLSGEIKIPEHLTAATAAAEATDADS